MYDTNVLLSALFSFTGPPFRCLVLARTGAVVIECAVTGNAKYVVTGDRHLINLEQYADIQLVLPAWFVELVATAD